MESYIKSVCARKKTQNKSISSYDSKKSFLSNTELNVIQEKSPNPIASSLGFKYIHKKPFGGKLTIQKPELQNIKPKNKAASGNKIYSNQNLGKNKNVSVKKITEKLQSPVEGFLEEEKNKCIKTGSNIEILLDLQESSIEGSCLFKDPPNLFQNSLLAPPSLNSPDFNSDARVLSSKNFVMY